MLVAYALFVVVVSVVAAAVSVGVVSPGILLFFPFNFLQNAFITRLLFYDVSKFVYDGNDMILGAAESLHKTACWFLLPFR